jgi:hypothetical protein
MEKCKEELGTPDLGSGCGRDGEGCSEAVGEELGGERNGSEIGYGVGLEMG